MTTALHKQIQIEIVIDEREVSLYDKCSEILSRNTSPLHASIKLVKRVLHLGDIAFHLITPQISAPVSVSDPVESSASPESFSEKKEIILFERKSLTDLLASIKDGRYKEQSHRLSNASSLIPHNIVYIIEGIYSTLKRPSDKATIMSCMTSLNFFKGFSVLKTASLNETAEYLIATAQKIVKDLQQGKPCPPINKSCRTNTGSLGGAADGSEMEMNGHTEVSSVDYCSVVKQVKKENVTKENIGEIILCQIPGISSITAIAIMKHFINFADLCGNLRENPAVLDTVVLETNGKTRKISRTSIQKIKEFLL